jgi:multiple sugar transport system permease protein
MTSTTNTDSDPRVAEAAPGKVIRRRRRDLSDGQFAAVLGLPVIALLGVIVAYPLGYSLWMSFHRIIFFGGYRTRFVGLENYRRIFSDPEIMWSAWVTLRFTAETVVLTMLIGLAIGLTLNQKMRFGGIIRTLVFLPWCVSLYADGLMFSYLAKGQTSILTSVLADIGIYSVPDLMTTSSIIEVLAIGSAWTMAPLVGFFILANLKTIPSRLYDLAAIDRLSTVATFFYVTLPPLRFTLFVFTSIVTVLTMKIFDFILVLSGGGPGDASSTLTYEIYKVSFKNFDLGYGSAVSFFLLFMIVGLTLLLYLVWGRRERTL